MVATYNIMGRQVGAHVLSMTTLGTFFGICALSMGGGQKAKEKGPPTNATSSDEDKFIKQFLEQANAEEKKSGEAKH